MVSLEDYLNDPCGSLSVPFWKWQQITVPEGMKIVHDSVFLPERHTEFADERYFRLTRTFEDLRKFSLDGYEIREVREKDIPLLVEQINRSYLDLQVSVPQMTGYRSTPVFKQDLWVLVFETATGTCAGSGIADYDARAKELILEWIQVLPEYRRRGIGRYVVNELLWRAKEYASFATVSGRKDDPSDPEELYRACGFAGDDVWHILRKMR